MGRLGGFAAMVAAAGGLAAASLVAGASPAAASMTGPCTAVATFVLGNGAGPIVIDVAKVPADQAIAVPAADTIAWTASAPASSVPRVALGRVEIDLPWPFGTQTLNSWSGVGASASQAGTYTYQLTGAVPRGVPVKFLGSHAEPGISCTGQVTLKVSGSSFSAWITWVALGGLALTGVLFYVAGRASWGRL